MRPFSYTRAAEANAATKQVSADKGAKFLAGGTNLLDLMKEGVENPSALVDISCVALNYRRLSPYCGFARMHPLKLPVKEAGNFA